MAASDEHDPDYCWYQRKKHSAGVKIFTSLRLSEGVVDTSQLKQSFLGDVNLYLLAGGFHVSGQEVWIYFLIRSCRIWDVGCGEKQVPCEKSFSLQPAPPQRIR